MVLSTPHGLADLRLSKPPDVLGFSMELITN
jgi:hypothetical protein